MGHSRLGKAALWAGALDSRFPLVISNNSGCGGAAIFRDKQGEKISDINRSFPHWFCDKFKEYNGEEFQLPVDQHMLLALIAPRPVYVASAIEDTWADPNKEFEALYEGGRLYEIYGLSVIAKKRFPAVGSPLINFHTGYHVRKGKHDVTLYDWQCFMDYADVHFNR